MTPPQGLAERVLRGGTVLLARQLLGAVLAFAGMLALARLLGPAQNGLYFTAFGIVFFIQNLAKLGLDTFLVRLPGPVAPATFDQIFVLLAGLGVLASLATIAASGLVSTALAMPELGSVLAVLAASIPLMHLYRVPLAKLERDLAFGAIGIAELAAQAVFFAVAIAAALAGWGVFAPVAGWWAQQAAFLGACFALSGYRPRLDWNRALAREALAYGSLATTAVLIQSLRPLIIPILVGGTQGPAAVGIVSLAIRLLENLSIARTVIARMTIPLFSRLASDRARLVRTFRLAIEIQTLAVALPITAFSLVAALAVPLLFGPRWTDAARMVTLLSPPMILMGVFGLHNLLLMTLRRPRALVLSQLAATAVAWSAATLLIPRVGAEGYAWAELAAATAWLVPAILVDRAFGRVRYDPALVWAAAASLAALAPLTTWWLVLAVPALALHRPTRNRLAAIATLARSRLPRRTPSALLMTGQP